MAYTAHTSVATIHSALAFNHSAILLPNIWLTPAIVTSGRNFSTIRPAYGLFWQQDSNLRISCVYLVRFPRKARGLNHSAILLP